jgi:hypothetical protein
MVICGAAAHMPVGNVSVGFMSVDDDDAVPVYRLECRMFASDGSGLYDSLPIQREQHTCHAIVLFIKCGLRLREAANAGCL